MIMLQQTIAFKKCPLRKVQAPAEAGDALFANVIPQDQLSAVRFFLSITPLLSIQTDSGFEALDTHLLGLARLAFKPQERIALAVLSAAPDDKISAHLVAYAVRVAVLHLRPNRKALLAWRLLDLPPEVLKSLFGASDHRTILRSLRINQRTFLRWRPK